MADFSGGIAIPAESFHQDSSVLAHEVMHWLTSVAGPDHVVLDGRDLCVVEYPRLLDQVNSSQDLSIKHLLGALVLLLYVDVKVRIRQGNAVLEERDVYAIYVGNLHVFLYLPDLILHIRAIFMIS